MPNFEMAASAVAMFGIASVMIFYEWARAKAGRPLLNGDKTQAIVLYWVAYLSLFVLGLTTAAAAFFR